MSRSRIKMVVALSVLALVIVPSIAALIRFSTAPKVSEMKRKIESPNQSELDWIEENLRKAKDIVGKEKEERIELKELDDAFARWLDGHDPKKEDPNPLINVFGIAFGQYLVDQFGLKWAVVTDDHGTEIAVHGQPGDILVFPTNFVAKRYVNRQKNFFSLFYPEMKKDIERFREMGERKP